MPGADVTLYNFYDAITLGLLRCILRGFAVSRALLHRHALTFACILAFARIRGVLAGALAFTRTRFFTLCLCIVAGGECRAYGCNSEQTSYSGCDRETLQSSFHE
jgi:hypothetical protein